MVLATDVSDGIDAALEALAKKAADWVALPIPEKLELLGAVHKRVVDQAEAWVAAAVKGKQIPGNTPLAGEEWISGPYPTITWIHGTMETLSAVAEGRDPLAHVKTRNRPDGQMVATVYPANFIESIVLHGYTVEVWMDDHVRSRSDLAAEVATPYTTKKGEFPGGVSVVLGAGNITSIAALDVLYKLFAELEVVVLKLNPVTDYLKPVYEACFAPLIDAGYMIMVDGGAEEGAYLTGHDAVTSIHMTGSANTHDLIVFGPGEEGARRKAANEPLTDKVVTSELGGVSPTIVLPGPWTKAHLAYQAEHVATQKLHNSGFNCVASQVLILPDGWDQAEAFVDKITEAMSLVVDRPAYYPGAQDRIVAARESHDRVEEIGPGGRRTILHGIDPTTDHYAFETEFFAPVLATTSLPAPSTLAYLRNAVEFANENLHGTLGANIIVHPATAKELGDELEQAVADLNYGGIAVNAWTGLAYLLTRATWGAAPGHTIDDVQSGIGVVHNSLLLDGTRKSVAWGPFRPFPRSLRHGELTLSPRPPWFVTNKTADVTSRRFTYYAADGKKSRLPGLFASALRG